MLLADKFKSLAPIKSYKENKHSLEALLDISVKTSNAYIIEYVSMVQKQLDKK